MMTDSQVLDAIMIFAISLVMLAVFWFIMALLLVAVNRLLSLSEKRHAPQLEQSQEVLTSPAPAARVDPHVGDDPQWVAPR